MSELTFSSFVTLCIIYSVLEAMRNSAHQKLTGGV